MDRVSVLINNRKRISVRIDESLSIGREGDNDLQLPDPKVSRYHCLLEREGGRLFIRDLESSNGTFVNGERVSQKALNGDEMIRIGGTVLLYEKTVDKETRHFGGGSGNSSPPGVTVIGRQDFRMEDLTDLYRPDFSRRDFRRILERLSALFEIGNIINLYRDSPSLLSAILNQITRVIRADRYFLLLRDGDRDSLRIAASYPEGAKAVEFSHTVLNTVLEEGKSVLSTDALHDDRFLEAKSIVAQAIRSVISVPLRSHEKILGVILVDSRDPATVFTRDDLKLLTAIGISSGVAIENLRLYEDLKKLYRSTVRSLVAALEANDPYTGGHSERVAAYVLQLSECLGLPKEMAEKVEMAAFLHDIGKIGIPNEVLNKPSCFTEKEADMMHRHPAIGYDILSKISGMEEIARIVRHHHEKFDGTGYPDGKAGKEIPFESRMLCVADVFDALTTDRPYRKRLGIEKARQMILSLSGTLLDPEIVDVFQRCGVGGSEGEFAEGPEG